MSQKLPGRLRGMNLLLGRSKSGEGTGVPHGKDFVKQF